ncbi:RUS1 family protein C16orf58 homolog isoform X1 [Phyllopteryx taeniolatus]|uniref:RUS1 family protein C16orf58 homolog isoform X1 n=2 Tax=Phyllopteryx taeniolatus TaxID=161469 RepID=UPI002AD2A023|nr:RUS1 family protein C16orf58 homolog isoform X1 [Phyllopteryx taeniolatus]
MEDCGALLATERYGSGESWQYVAKNGAMQRTRDGSKAESSVNSLVGFFKNVFLPQGYPESVSGDYLQYQFWDTLQAFSSSLSGMLATQASLRGVGVGNQEATVAAATVTWLLRDGTSMLGRIVFAWLKGNKLDSEAKKWRLFADILNDIAMFMEILAQFFPTWFTLIVCTSGIFKSVVGVAGGATRAALTVHQARRDNMADISAKDGSQETLVNLAGLLVSLILIPLVTDSPALTISLFFLFTALHLFANYKAVRSVVMETLNEARLVIVLRRFLRDGHLLTPLEANREEPVFLEFWKMLPIKLGVRLQEVVQSPEELHSALIRKDAPFLLGVTNGCICVCLAAHAHTRDEIRAMCQAIWLRDMLSPSKQHHGFWEMVHKSHKLMDAEFDRFHKGVEAAGWDVTRTLLDWDEWRLEWKSKVE